MIFSRIVSFIDDFYISIFKVYSLSLWEVWSEHAGSLSIRHYSLKAVDTIGNYYSK